MIWLWVVAAAVVGFAGGFTTCAVFFREPEEDDYNEIDGEVWR